MRLSDLSIRALPVPAKGQKLYYDSTSIPGFGVRVSQGGARTFVLVHGRRRQFTKIGRYPIITLAQARTRAREILAKQTLGLDRPEAPRFADAIELFVTKHCLPNNRPSTAAETARLLRKHFLPRFRDLPIDEIGRHRVASVLDELLDRPSIARHAFVAVRTFFNWSARRGLIELSPIAHLRPPVAAVSRDRVLNDSELAAVYRDAVSLGHAGGVIAQLLVLTGQRRGEIGALRAEHVNRDARTVTLPALLAKNGRQHTFPYGDMAAALFETLPRSGFLFPARGSAGEKPYCGWSKLKANLQPDIAQWTFHDLRRTFATNLAQLEVPPHVIERLLNHVSGTVSGVAAIYNRYAYLPEMRNAICLWEDRLRAILASEAP
ncbi:MAG TPA: tyrosine-type recombinase/integrase [Stellaceae bacterium]|nr:tyrosine-type recombinase/integrase [Stellaceae bacterium]